MVSRASAWIARAAIAAATAGLLASAAPGQFLVFDREAEAYGRYAAAAGARIKVGRGAAVDGSLHSNQEIDLKSGSSVSGDVTSVGRVKNRGQVAGRITEGAAVVALPEMPTRTEARALATRVLQGPVTLVDERVDDVLFVAGALRIEGSLHGSGTVIATGPIELAAAGADMRWSILSFADVEIEPRSTLRGLVRARGRVMVGEGATFAGSLLADGDVELGPGSRIALATLGDFVAPALTILAPVAPVVLDAPSVELTLLYADSAPGIDLSSLALSVNGIDATDRCSIGDGAATCSAEIASSGEQEIVATVGDLDGNRATRTLVFAAILDAVPPSIVIESPLDGALVSGAAATVRGTVSDDGVVTLVTVGGATADVRDGRFEAAIALGEGGNLIQVGARDSVGRTSERSIAVTLDSAPPRLTLRSPAGSASGPVATHLPSIRIAGAAIDEHGIASLEVAGAPASHADGSFDQEVALAEGVNRIRVAAVDPAGNVGAVELEVERWSVPAITVLEPADGALVLEETIDVSGTVDSATATVTVDGIPAAVSGTSFLLEGLAIADGANLVNVLATGSGGLVGSAGVTVVRDRQPPIVVVREPADGAVVYLPTVTVAGTVNDIVVGTVNSAQVTVAVNGAPAEVANRSFLIEQVALEHGDNVITVEAVDPSGNVGRQAIVVRRAAPVGPTIAIASGDLQAARVGDTLPRALVASLRDATGAPVPGQVVTFVADGTDGGFEGGARRQVATTTDGDGLAAVSLTLGRRAGRQSVRATAIGFAGEAVFTARAIAGAPAVLVVDAGDQQVGAAGSELRAPLQAVVTDDGFNRLEGVPIRFAIVAGGGHFENGASEIDRVSDSDGRVTARLTLGDEEGIGNNVVEARVDAEPAPATVTFAASALVAKDPGATSVSGVVLDNTDQPVPGATVSLEGTALETRTDAAGFFSLAGAPVGTMHLRVDGRTVAREGVWPSLEFLITTVAGRDNSMGRPIFVLPLATENALAVDDATGGVLTMLDLPGFALHVAPGSVTFPGGRRSGVLTVTAVHSDKVPMPPNFGQQPRFVITIQPGGARFDPPAPVVFPNVDGLAPGQVTELYSFDHDLARFVSIGSGTVTGDGTRIESDPGVGIAKAGWHGGGDPDRPATCHDCGACRQASGGACVADDTMTPPQKAPDDCRLETCANGGVTSRPNDQETARQIAGNCFEERCSEPVRVLDLADAPAPRRCCGNAEINAPVGRLAGIYDPRDECCIEDGLFLVDKGPPLDVAPELCPDRQDAAEVPTDFDGCSGGLLATLFLYLDSVGHFSGDRNAPTPPGELESEQDDARFSDEPDVPSLPALPCDRHDDCYQTCDASPDAREACDRGFYEDMLDVCSGVTGTIEFTDELSGISVELSRSGICSGFAQTYFTAVHGLGGGAFEAGQRTHCRCCP